MSNNNVMKFDENFIDKYRGKQPPWGFGALSYIVYKRTYSQFNQTEEWWQTLQRVVEGAQEIGADLTKSEMEKLYDYMFNLKCSVGGRVLWQMGTDTVRRFGANSLLNCFAGETKVLTRQGWKEIQSLAGQTVELVTSNGKWVSAPIRCFGKQKLYKITFQDSYSSQIPDKTIYATADHDWIVLDENKQVRCKTKDLIPGETYVPTITGRNSSRVLSPQGVQHGLVFGDGCLRPSGCQVDLIGNTYEYCSKYFSLNRCNEINNGKDFMQMRYDALPNFYKSLPDINENKKYLMGFLAGWIAADGNVHKSSGAVRLFNRDKSVLYAAMDYAAACGIRTSDPNLERDYSPYDEEEDSELWSISFYRCDFPEWMLIREDHLSNFKNNNIRNYKNKAKVISVEETDREDFVYCATVDDTHSFVIDGNILTGNCWYVNIDTIESFLFLFENLMLGGGVGFSVKREHVHEFPKVKPNIKIKHERTADADFIVPDSREGWRELIRKALESFFITGKSFTYSTIIVRGAGEKIKTFGGVSSGPLSLIEGIEDICKVLSARENKKIRSIDALDICNILGKIVVSGNVRRCLPAYSRVIEKESGYKAISDIKIGDRVSTINGWKKVSNVFYQGKQKCVRVVHQDGYLDCTPNHRVAVLIDQHGKFEWKNAEDLKSGDRLIFLRNISEGKKTELPDFYYDYSPHSTTCQKIIIPELDEPMAWLMGLIAADGYVYANREKNGFNAYVGVTVGIDEMNIAEKCKTQLERFGVNVYIKKVKGENAIKIIATSKQLAYYLDENIKKPNQSISIPRFIVESCPSIRVAYVSGVLDGDGSVRNRPTIICSSVYLDFVKDIQNLLYSCGIESRFRYKNDIEYKESYKSRPAEWQHIHDIGFITKRSLIQFLEQDELIKSIEIKSRSQNANGFPTEWFSSLKKGASKDCKQINIDTYERLYLDGNKNDILPVEVIKIEDIEEEFETYDIEVEDEHSFICEGVLVHNSAELAIGDIDDVLFLKAKRWDLHKLPSWRSNSNNSVYCDEIDDLLPHFWDGFKGNGECYGLINIKNAKRFGRAGQLKKDPTVEGFNPCAEEQLAPFECCNLSELFLNNIESEEELFECASLLYKVQKAICNLNYLHEETEKIVHKNMRIGIGVTGVYQSFDKLKWLSPTYDRLVKYDEEWSKKKGYPVSIRLTTVKPSGTLSNLSGSSPGGHPAFGEYIVRNVRFATNDPLVGICKDCGYNVEYEIRLDGTINHDVSVVSFPCRFVGENVITEKEVSVEDQMNMIKNLQTIWSDSSVSCTIYFEKDEVERIKNWLKENYKENIKSISFGLKTDAGFVQQMPLIEITKEEYDKLNDKIKDIDDIFSKIITGELESQECSTGACPVK